jgi:hypothetical protein
MTRISKVVLALCTLAAFVVGGLVSHSVATASTPKAKKTVTHVAQYKHITSQTYQVQLTEWALGSEYTLFKKAAGSDTYNEVVNSTKSFDGAVTFNVGVRTGTSLEVDVWNGQQATYAFAFTADGTPTDLTPIPAL